jgi:hypothetical protein
MLLVNDLPCLFERSIDSVVCQMEGNSYELSQVDSRSIIIATAVI